MAPAGKDALTKILTYHVVAGRNLAASLTTGNLGTLYTFSGSAATLAVNTTAGVQITDEILTVATVTTADLQASNGVIHAMGDVLVPPPQRQGPDLPQRHSECRHPPGQKRRPFRHTFRPLDDAPDHGFPRFAAA